MQATDVGPVLEQSVHSLVGSLDAAVRLGEVDAITDRVKCELARMISERSLLLPERCLRSHPERYARHLLYRSEDHGYTAVVMVWGPGQRTGLHDHSGLWCVEGVVEGELEITRYERLGDEDAACRFEECERVHASAGSSGSLIPPHEYHVLANDSVQQPAITLHIYGGEMTACSVFEPQADGSFVRRERHLSYDD